MRVYTIILFNILIVLSCFSQTDSTSVIKDTITVEKDFNFDSKLEAPYLTTSKFKGETPKYRNFKYVEVIPEIDVETKVHSVKPIRHKITSIKNSNDGIVSIGFGLPRALDAKIYYDYHIEDWYHLGAKADYSSANDDIIPNMRFNDLDTRIYGGYWFAPRVKLSASYNYERRDQGIYSEEANNLEVFDGGKRITQHSMGSATLSYAAFESKGIHASSSNDLGRFNLLDLNQNQVHYSSFNKITKSITEGLSVDLQGTLAGAKNSNALWRHFWLAEPTLNYQSAYYVAQAGVGIMNTPSKRHFWPILRGVWMSESLPMIVELNSTLRGDLQTMQALYSTNSFLSNTLQEANVTTYQSVSLLGNYTVKKHQIGLSIGYDRVTNALQYSYTNNGLFDLSYSPAFTQFPVGISSLGSLTRWLSYEAQTKYTFYDETGDNIGYLPKLHIDISLIQSLTNDKLKMKQGFVFMTRNARNGSTTNEPILDLSLQANYKIYRNFEVFVKGSNLLFSDYEIWDNYAIFRPYILGGFTYLID